MTHWYQKTIPEVIEQLDSDSAQGLTNAQVALRIDQHGPNELIEMGGRGPWRILWEQLSGAMVLMLMIAAVVSVVLHEYTDAVVIIGIVVLNAALGFVQDYRAERALAALKRLAVPVVRVRRQGAIQEINSRVGAR
ncbi:MAG: cation-transporting P-type ATPase [Pirellulaceae bacterium]